MPLLKFDREMRRRRLRRFAASVVPGLSWVRRRLLAFRLKQSDRVPANRPLMRQPQPIPDPEKLRKDYMESPMSAAPDTFVLYRIIGNDLPPRHKQGQSRENLAFILENESALHDCEKRFVVNRIVDAGEEQAIIDLLEAAGMPYIHVPYDMKEYHRVRWDVAGVPACYAPWGARFPRLSEAERRRIEMRLYRHKNNYVMNNNGARNAALHDGKSRAKWVLPWDGNCFLTASAWEEIRSSVLSAPEHPYFIVPMARMTDNLALLEPGYRPQASEEPQILFRRDSSQEFDADYPYGRRPKVELLWRLGVPGVWDEWGIEPWDLPCPPYAAEAGTARYAGWVARLFSGQTILEVNRKEGGAADRALARVEAVRLLLDRLDDSKPAPALVEPCFMRLPGDAECVDGLLKQRLFEAAEAAMARGQLAVVAERGDDCDRTPLQRLFDDTMVLALATLHFGNRQYAEHGANLVRGWFLESDTRMSPHLKYSRTGKRYKGNIGVCRSIVEMNNAYYFLDGIRILAGIDTLRNGELLALQGWFSEYLHWLRSSLQGREERSGLDSHGTYYDLQVASIAAFIGDVRCIRETLRDSQSRILQQFGSDGVHLEEMKHRNPAHHCCFNMQGWIHLAQIASNFGEDLWSFEDGDGRGIRRSMDWLLSGMLEESAGRESESFDRERLYPIFHTFLAQYGMRERRSDIVAKEEIKPLFHPYDGIMPFWQLSQYIRWQQPLTGLSLLQSSR